LVEPGCGVEPPSADETGPDVDVEEPVSAPVVEVGTAPPPSAVEVEDPSGADTPGDDESPTTMVDPVVATLAGATGASGGSNDSAPPMSIWTD